jgi:outer membrane protein assembly factor BamB
MGARRDASSRDDAQLDGPLGDQDRSAGVIWRFRVGAPLSSAPGVAPDGTVYVAARDGSVCALGREGVFRWGYTLPGPVAGGTATDSDGRFYVATTSRQLYALSTAGAPAWMFRSPVPVVTDLALGRGGALYFGGADQHMWAVSSRAVALFRVPAAGGVTAGPATSPSGKLVAFGAADGRLWVVHAIRRFTAPRKYAAIKTKGTVLGGRLEQPPVVSDDGAVYAVAGGRLVSVGPSGEVRWARAGVDFVARAGPGKLAAASRHGRVMLLSADGSERARYELGGELAGAPVRDGDGVLYAPGADGSLWLMQESKPPQRLVLAHAALFGPRLDPSRRRLLVASGDGSVMALRAGVWPQ